MSSDGICVGGENVKTLSLLVTGTGLAAQGVSSFIAAVGETYDFQVSGTSNVVSSGLNSSQSYAQFISGQCASAGTTFQPWTTNFAVGGPTPQFGDNAVAYTPSIADMLGGCIWQVCVVSNDTTVAPACVDMIASVDPVAPVTTTLPPTTTLPVTTTLPPPTTTLPPSTTTTTSTSTTLPHPTTTTTMPLPTTTTSTTTTTLPHPVTTTTSTSTTTTTQPHVMPKITGNVCAGGGSNQYNCVSFPEDGTGANHLKHDIGCTTNVTISYLGKTVSTSLFGNAAPYYPNGNGIGTTSKSVSVQGVNFMIYITDEYSVSGMGNWIACTGLVTWPNFPNPPLMSTVK
jgi:hypothetical protein